MSVLKRINNNLNETVQRVPYCKNKVQAVPIMLERAYLQLRYHLQKREYFAYEFYNLKRREQLTYVREYEVVNTIPNKFSSQTDRMKLDDKHLFDCYYKDFIGRKFCFVDSTKHDEFINFCSQFDAVMIKPLDSWCGHGIKKVVCAEENLEQLFKELSSGDGMLVEEVFQQHEKMAQLNPDSVNTVRAISLVNEQGEIDIPIACVRCGRSGSCVDNINSGGMAAELNVETGIICSPAYAKTTSYYIHPDTGTQIIGFQIPYWDKVIETIKTAATMLKTVRFIGWDVVIDKNGNVCFMEGNSNPEMIMHQVNNRRGMRKEFEKSLGKF